MYSIVIEVIELSGISQIYWKLDSLITESPTCENKRKITWP